MEKTSSSKVILSIIIILVVAAVGFAMLRSNQPGDGMTATTTPTNPNAFSGSIFDLVARGGDWKCMWSSAQNGVELEGTTFVSRGKFKSDVEMNGNGMHVTAHALGDGANVYSWTSLMPTGIKFPVTQGATGVAVTGTNAQMAQFAGDYNYDCDPWKADSGAFALPTGITFSESAAAPAPMPMMKAPAPAPTPAPSTGYNY